MRAAHLRGGLPRVNDADMPSLPSVNDADMPSLPSVNDAGPTSPIFDPPGVPLYGRANDADNATHYTVDGDTHDAIGNRLRGLGFGWFVAASCKSCQLNVLCTAAPPEVGTGGRRSSPFSLGTARRLLAVRTELARRYRNVLIRLGEVVA